jgi:hypothetical protein
MNSRTFYRYAFVLVSAMICLGTAHAQTGTSIPPGPNDDSIRLDRDLLRMKSDVQSIVEELLSRIKICPRTPILHFDPKSKTTIYDIYVKILLAEVEDLESKKCSNNARPILNCIFRSKKLKSKINTVLQNPMLNNDAKLEDVIKNLEKRLPVTYETKK